MKKILFLVLLLSFSSGIFALTTNSIHMKKNDNQPYYFAQIKDSAGDAVDLSTATVTFSMVDATDLTDTPKIDDVAMVVTDATNGYVEYRWASGDTDTVGIYVLEIKVTIGSLIYTLPTNRQDKIIIVDRFSTDAE